VRVVEAQRERARTLKELAQISLFYYQDFGDYDPAAAKKALKAAAVEPLKAIRERLEAVDTWERAAIHRAMTEVVAGLGIGFGKLGMPLRVAVTGGQPSPDLDLTLELVGRDACLRRVDQAVEYIRAFDG
jgi:glutamyl-tRNA synthetase